MRKTTRGVEKSILDFFVVCSKILPFITKMAIDDRREHALTNYSTVKNLGRVVESDHNVETLDIDLIFSNQKPERIQMFDFKNSEGQSAFKILTSNTDEFSNCFMNNLSFEDQATNWRKVLDTFFYKSFKKIRITKEVKKKKSDIQDLMDRRNLLKKKQNLNEMKKEKCLILKIRLL